MESDSLTFANWLRSELDRRGMSQAELARAINTATSTVSYWVNGKRLPDPASCRRIAAALGVNADVVLDAAGHRDLKDPPSRYQLESEVKELRRTVDSYLRMLQEGITATVGVAVQIIGRVPADAVRWTDLSGQGRDVRVPEDWVQHAHSPFALEVSGDCLRSLGILSGDIVICDRPADRAPRNGQVVVVQVGDEVTMKVWERTGDHIELRDGDGHTVHRLTVVDKFEVLGFFLALVRLPR